MYGTYLSEVIMKCKCAEILKLFSDYDLQEELDRRRLERDEAEREEIKNINEELANDTKGRLYR
jgi:hypothetical protein